VDFIKKNNIQQVEDMMKNFDVNKFEFPSEQQEPIFIALAGHYIEIARLLIKNNCKLDILNREGYSPLHLCLKEDELNSLLLDILSRPIKKDLEKTTRKGHYPLHIAVYHNNIEGINRLLSLNVNINPKTPNGKTPLHIACISSNIETVKALLTYPLCLVNSQDNYNNTPLHFALKRKDWETAYQIAYLLHERSANSELSNRNSKKPIEESLHFGLHQLVELAKIQQDFNPMSKWKKWEIDPPDSLFIDYSWPIGKGGFGEVYRGKLYGTVCAVKQIKSNENSIEKINHEIGIMGDAHHPNLVCLLGMCKRDDFVYIITEYIDQGCLRDYLARNSCNEAMIIKMSLDITRGMAWLHSRKPPIFHRDLHTRNILVSSSGTLKLCDFGLSLVKGEVFLSNSLYKRIIPPELQASGDFSGYSAPSDVFMFGLVLFELITKHKANNQITRGNLEDIRERSGPTTHILVNLVENCISENPLNRPTFEQIINILEIQEEQGGNERSEIPLQYVIDNGYKS